jgi:hypothetical protein
LEHVREITITITINTVKYTNNVKISR